MIQLTFTTQDFIKQQILSTRRRRKLSQRTSNGVLVSTEQLSIIENMAIGIASALVAGIITNPIDVVKTRMMTQASSSAIPYTSALDCVQSVLQKEGFGTFYAGFKQRSIYMCGLWGITFAINDKLNQRPTPKKTD